MALPLAPIPFNPLFGWQALQVISLPYTFTKGKRFMNLPSLLFFPALFTFQVSLSQVAGTSTSPNKRKPKPESFIQRYDPSVNQVFFAQDRFPNITGRGQTVSIKERLFDTTDLDLKGRWFSTGFTATQQDRHATEMATLAAGNGNSGYEGRGGAYQAKITGADFANLMPEPTSYYTANGITVQNHSYGTGIENEYAPDAAAYDLSSWADTSLLHIFSAGNQGLSTPANGLYAGIPGFSNLTGSFKMSKNSLSVGGCDSVYKVEGLSSRGPAYDGRIKPELVAFGIDGSSGAAALVSGAALLLQQSLYPFFNANPPASLVKALLIEGANPIGEDGPNYISGFGHLDVHRSLWLSENRHFFTGNATQGQQNPFAIKVPSTAAFLKVTLCWTDTAAPPFSGKALINDLDLSILAPDGTTHYPWVLSAFPHIDSLGKKARRGIDSLNPVEQVFVTNPISGIYTIRVNGKKLLSTEQRFSLAYDFQPKDSLYITYPVKSTPVPAGQNTIIRWQSFFAPNTPITLEYKLKQSNQWQLIGHTQGSSQGYFHWQAPFINSLATIRVSAAAKTFTSDTFFIAQPFTVSAGYLCGDTALVYWNKQPEISQYNVYTLGDTVMQKQITTTDTLVKINIRGKTDPWVAVAALYQGAPGFENRMQSFNLFNQGMGCYFKNFLAQYDNHLGLLSISLSTLYNIQSVTIQKQQDGQFRDLRVFNNPTSLELSETDNQLRVGANIYKATIRLLDGRIIESEWQSIIETLPEGWWVYPNPVKRGGALMLINRWSETMDLFVDIYDVHGRKSATRLVPLIDNSIPVTNLAAGMYFLVFNDGKKMLGTQKLIVLP